jgi:hypothetical protein
MSSENWRWGRTSIWHEAVAETLGGVESREVGRLTPGCVKLVGVLVDRWGMNDGKLW